MNNQEVTEIQFLIDLLLTHPKMPEAIKSKLIARIGYAEQHLHKAVILPQPQQLYQPRPAILTPVQAGQQSPSTQRILDQMAAEGKGLPVPVEQPVQVVQEAVQIAAPVAVIAQTQATAQALAERQKAIAIAMSGKPEQGRTSPRKF